MSLWILTWVPFISFRSSLIELNWWCTKASKSSSIVSFCFPLFEIIILNYLKLVEPAKNAAIMLTDRWLKKDRGKGEKGEESIGGIKKRLRNSTWIGERISLNWIKVYGFRQSSLLSLLRLCRMLLFLYWHRHFKLFSVDTPWQVITQSCKLLGIFGSKKNPLCFYTNVPPLNKLEEYVNFTDCLKMWPELPRYQPKKHWKNGSPQWPAT